MRTTLILLTIFFFYGQANGYQRSSAYREAIKKSIDDSRHQWYYNRGWRELLDPQFRQKFPDWQKPRKWIYPNEMLPNPRYGNHPYITGVSVQTGDSTDC